MNNVLETIHSLRTTHGNFSSREITDQDMTTILDASVRAANASNRQSYSLITVKDRKIMKKLCGYAGSRTIIFCIDYNRIIETAKYLNYSYSPDGLDRFVLGSTDTILAAQTAAIAAKSLGIDSLFTNGIHRGDISRVYELLDLPEKYCFPLVALVLGYPDREPDFKVGRLRGTGVVHHDKYHKLTRDEIDVLVKQHNDPDKELGIDDRWREMGLKNYLDWYYTKWDPGVKGRSRMDRILQSVRFLE